MKSLRIPRSLSLISCFSIPPPRCAEHRAPTGAWRGKDCQAAVASHTTAFRDICSFKKDRGPLLGAIGLFVAR
eukprot:scaffold26500_cov101-Isochrysis_galbana.AAC.7